ncbi:F0F1 ATP synthase subunit delta [Lentibacillus sp. CBA3610]|uniref:F0F1 ATP synthase subunit delta n=1 Tax=Lentibacillus sp. CBA3610 TaxID=2518176 RepID=UPI001595045A|nr:F0F1 ATP synthase subunit delta [Lentibacillus sp. CBA3610]QKY70477.1 F0F1 ATP synthase subunit delta [Lentibacillus sp. CBA3610]
MSEVVANRYAEALFQLGDEKGILEQLASEFHVLKSIFDENEQLAPFLEHPRVNNDRKKAFIDEVFQGFSNDVINTMKLLITRDRIGLVPSITDHFTRMVNDVKGIAEAKVYSVRELSDDERKQLEETFAKRFNKQAVKIQTIVDPSVLGGIKLQIGNTIYDGTISAKLRRIERNVVTAD